MALDGFDFDTEDVKSTIPAGARIFGVESSSAERPVSFSDAALSDFVAAVLADLAYTQAQVNTLLSGKANVATTLGGYGISDAYTKAQTDTLLAGKAAVATTLAGYGIADAYTSAAVNALLATYQPLDADLSAIAALATTSYGRSLLTLADAAAGRTALSLAPVAGSGLFADLLSKPTTLAGYGITDAYTQAQTTALRLDQFAVPNADLSLNSHKLTNVTDPVAAQDAATKSYVDSLANGFDVKPSARVATTANITLSGAQTIDGVSAVAGDRVLVKNQSTPSQNGIYVVASGAWARALDMDAWSEVPGAFLFVEEGTTFGDCAFVCTANQGGTIGTTAVTWSQTAGAGTYTAASGVTLTGTQFSLSPIATARLFGNVSGSSAAPVELTLAQAKTLLAMAFSDLSGQATLAQLPTIGAATILGNNGGAGAVPVALTAAQTKTLLAIANTDVSGLGTASVANTGTNGHNLLFGDGANTWSGQFTNALGTITVDTPFTLSATLNAAGVAFQGLLIDWTSTASAAGSLPINVKVGGTTVWKVDKTGLSYAADGNVSFPGVSFTTQASMGMYRVASNVLGFSSGNAFTFGSNPADATFKALSLGLAANSGGSSSTDVRWERDAADIAAQRRAANPQARRTYNTFTTLATNFECFTMDAGKTTSNVYRLMAEKGSGTGSLRLIAIDGFSKAGAPANTDLPAGTWALVKDTSGGGVSLVYNDAGTLKSVALT